jgi:recombination protein RecA
LKFYSSIRIKLTSSKSAGNKEKVDGIDRQVSNLVTATTEKNKTYPPLQKHSFQLKFGVGIDAKEEIVDMAIALGLIEKKGAWYSYEGSQLGQGKKAVFALLGDNPDLEDILREEITKHYNQ